MQTSHKRIVVQFCFILLATFAFTQTEIVDLALRKTSTVTTYTGSGQEIEFTITIFNQGNIALTNITLTDYIPTQMTLSTTKPNGWTSGAGGITAAKIYTGIVNPGDSVKILIYLVTKAGATGTIKNTAEISSVQDINFINRSLDDIDSTPDGFNTEVNVKDDVIDENGFISGQDEDDHDISYVYGVPNPFAFKTVRWLPAPGNTSSTPRVADTLLYTVAAFNTGTGDLDNFKIIDTLPFGVQRVGVSNLRATGGSNASLNSQFGISSHEVLKKTDTTQSIKLKANGYLYVNLRVIIKMEALGLTLSNQAWLLGINTVFLSDTKDSTSAPSILIDPSRPELRTNVFKSYPQSIQTDALDPTLLLVSTTLPIDELIYFQATKVQSKIELKWKTEREYIAGYGIERSKDGTNFRTIGNMAAKNTFSNSYIFFDNNPFSNTNYYRLRIEELDGSYSYSPVVSIDAGNESFNSLTVFPNPPVGQEVTVYTDDIEDGTYSLEITDVVGKKLASAEYSVDKGYFSEKILLPENCFSSNLIIRLINFKTNKIRSFRVLKAEL